MTDNEIIKLLKCCKKSQCSKCYYSKECDGYTQVNYALDLITRQQAEIERLKSTNDEKFSQWNMLAEKTKQHYADLYNEAKDIFKSEAVKEFADGLKNKIKTECNPYGKPTFDYDTSLAIMRYIDNLVKEMVGEKE